MRGIFFAFFLLSQLLLAPPLLADDVADTVWVRKSERILYLLKDYRIIRSYPISLGANPEGHKLASGDSRTPEGLYLIDWRNADSKFYLSLHISYPNEHDLRRAADAEVDPGGSIMIHGYPDAASGEEPLNFQADWTDGCVALANDHIEEIWQLVADGVPVLIDP